MNKKYFNIVPFICAFISMSLCSQEDSRATEDVQQYAHSALLDAITKKDIDAIKQYIKQHPKAVHAKNRYGQIPLHVAACYGNSEITALLIEAGSVIDGRDFDAHTPLSLAVHNDAATVQVLVSHGADVNAVNCLNDSPLHMAAEKGNLSIIQHLAAHGGNLEAVGSTDNTPLHLLATHGHHAALGFILSRTNNRDPVNQMGYTPLYEAALEGHLQIVKDLVRRGARFRGPDLDWLPINAAASKGHIEVISYLLEQDPHCIDDTDKLGYTALAWAIAYGQIPTIKFLLKHEAVTDGPEGGSLIRPRTIVEIQPLAPVGTLAYQKPSSWKAAFYFLLCYGVPVDDWGKALLQRNDALMQRINTEGSQIFQCLLPHIQPYDLCKLILSFVSLTDVQQIAPHKRKSTDSNTHEGEMGQDSRKRQRTKE